MGSTDEKDDASGRSCWVRCKHYAMGSTDEKDNGSGPEDSSSDTLGSQVAPGVVNFLANTAEIHVSTSASPYRSWFFNSKDHSRHT